MSLITGSHLVHLLLIKLINALCWCKVKKDQTRNLKNCFTLMAVLKCLYIVDVCLTYSQ